jgi:hypothetical protein
MDLDVMRDEESAKVVMEDETVTLCCDGVGKN